MLHSPPSCPTPILRSLSLYSPDLWCHPCLHSSLFPLLLLSVPTTDPCRQLQGKSYDCAKSIQFKLCMAGCVWQCGGKGGWGWWMAFTGSKPLPPLSIFLSHLSDFSPWGFGSQHTNTLHCYCIVISIYKSYMNNGQKGKVECRFYHLQDNFLWFSMSD